MLPLTGYVRVSQVKGRSGDSFISPRVQEERIRGWCSTHGYTLDGDVLVELDESGARADRPKLIEAMRRVESGQSGGIVVAKLDRFGRSLVDALAMIERLQARGAVFASVADGFDLTTDTGRLVLRIMLALAEFELDRVRGNFADGRRSAVARGLHLSARPPVGYLHVKDQDGKLIAPLEVDPVAGPVITEVFARRAAGASWTDLVAFIAEHGIPTSWGNTSWSRKTVRTVIGNRVYLGEARHGEFVTPGAHPPLTDESTFRLANERGHAPRKAAGRAPSFLQGLIRCGTCRYSMASTGLTTQTGTYRRWSCIAHTSSGVCEQPAAISTASPIEQYVADALRDRLAGATATATEEAPDIGDTLEADLQAARRVFEAYRDSDRVIATLGIEAYEAGLEKHAQRVADLERQVDERTAAKTSTAVLSADLVADWDSMPIEAQQRIARAAIVAVFIRPGRSRHTPLSPDNIRIAWRGEHVPLPGGVTPSKLPPVTYDGPPQ